MTTLNSPLTGTPYPSTSSNAISSLLNVPDAVLWLEKYVMTRFASTAARDAAIASPEPGMVTYITASPPQIYVYNGVSAAWELVWQGGALLAWTPTVASGLTVGNGVWTGSYIVKEKWCKANFSFTMGTTSSVTGAILLLNPVAIRTTYPAFSNQGVGSLYDLSATTTGRLPCTISVNSTASSGVGSFLFSTSGGQANATVPFTWATGDVFSGTLEFETT